MEFFELIKQERSWIRNNNNNNNNNNSTNKENIHSK